MRLNEIKHAWRPWQPGKDNHDANIDVPLSEGLQGGHNKQISRILETRDEDFGPPMSIEEALEWARR